MRLVGVAAAIVGAAAGIAVWMEAAVLAAGPVTFVAVIVGVFAGLGARIANARNAYAAGLIALMGCAAGTVYAEAAAVATQRSTAPMTYIAHMPVFVAVYTFETYFRWSDILWYAVAILAASIIAGPRGVRRTGLPAAENRAPGAAT